MIIPVNLGAESYDIIIERGALGRAGELLGLRGKTLVVTDGGVPREYAEKVAAQAENATLVTIPQGEESKCFEQYERLCRTMLGAGFTRSDIVVAVGGGVVGDLSGFAAATYMRGINFYNIPTTVLSQVDSSVGGKTAIDLDGIKNIIGAFYQPKKVLIDPDVLKTLPKRQFSNGLAEALKMAATCDGELFGLIGKGAPEEDIEEIIYRSLIIKKNVVERDERESGLRMILNFGHTLGHGIESTSGLYHGECVSLGMVCMVSEELVPRMRSALEALGLPVMTDASESEIMKAVTHDKKIRNGEINAVFVDEIGKADIRKTNIAELKERLGRVTKRS